MHPLTAQVEAWFARRWPPTPGVTIVVAVSGGPDSLCLLHVLAALRPTLQTQLHVAHLDHLLRGAQSAAEAQFVADTAAAWNLPVTIAARDVAAIARARHQNRHHVARELRYQFLHETAQVVGAAAVALAHTADDQAETLLLHLLRGAGPAGLRGMRDLGELAGILPQRETVDKETSRPGDRRPQTADPETRRQETADRREEYPESNMMALGPRASLPFLRPLLGVTRAEIEAYCAEHGLQPRHDPSNTNPAYARSRIRHMVLPALRRYEPQVVTILNRAAAIQADVDDFVAQALDAAWPQLAQVSTQAVVLDAAVWASLPPALRREALRRAYRLLDPATTLPLAHVELALDLAARRQASQADLPGGVRLLVTAAGGLHLLAGGALAASISPATDAPQLISDTAQLPIPGVLALAGGWQIEARLVTAAGVPGAAWHTWLDAARLGSVLTVRRRQPGDRMRPAGGRGSRRVQDLFVDAKVPHALRAAWPLVLSGDEIVWLPGLRAAAGYLATPTTPEVAWLRVVVPAAVSS